MSDVTGKGASLEGAVANLREHQVQLDQDGVMVAVSREALTLVLDGLGLGLLQSLFPSLHPSTTTLLNQFIVALADKLKRAQDKYGYSDGWMRDDWEDECRQHLAEHVQKGDPLDVAAYSAFCWKHGWSTALTPPTEPPSAGREGWKLVPVEPTREMLVDAGTMDGFAPQHLPYDVTPDQAHIHWWKLMLAAAPSPEPQPSEEEGGTYFAPDSGVRGRLQVAPSPWRTIDSAPKDGTSLARRLGFAIANASPSRTVGELLRDIGSTPGAVAQALTRLPDGPTAQVETGVDATRFGWRPIETHPHEDGEYFETIGGGPTAIPMVAAWADVRRDAGGMIEEPERWWTFNQMHETAMKRWPERAEWKPKYWRPIQRPGDESPPERDQSREEPKPLSPETSALLAEAESLRYTCSDDYAWSIVQRLSQALREARG